jgi:hypothetical protein
MPEFKESDDDHSKTYVYPDGKLHCDFCKEIIDKPIVQRCLSFCDPILVIRFCSNECSIRWEADMFVSKSDKKKKKYLEKFIPEAKIEDDAIGVKSLDSE